MNFHKASMNRFEEIARSLYDPFHPIRTFHVSFILHKRKIVSIGINKTKSHPTNLFNPRFEEDSEKGVCSELDAVIKLINKTKIDTKNCKLINVRIDRNQELNISKPCVSCEKLIRYHGFKQVLYTNEKGKFEKWES